jgi:hypothetical protein
VRIFIIRASASLPEDQDIHPGILFRQRQSLPVRSARAPLSGRPFAGRPADTLPSSPTQAADLAERWRTALQIAHQVVRSDRSSGVRRVAAQGGVDLDQPKRGGLNDAAKCSRCVV